jgi:hypothetical protein
MARLLLFWLKFPTELDACPDEMEHVKRVTFDFNGRNHFVHFEVFRYRVNEPRRAAKAGWMPGVECCDKFLYTAQTTVGSKGKLSSRYIEQDGKLFFRRDDDFPLSEEMIALLWKYNLPCDDTAGLIGIPEFTVNKKQKGADYYYGKYNLSKYKKVIINTGRGHYKPPKS